jgi:hypothetical protein
MAANIAIGQFQISFVRPPFLVAGVALNVTGWRVVQLTDSSGCHWNEVLATRSAIQER